MKLFITSLLMTIAVATFAQDEVIFPKNEIKTNVLNDLIGIATLNYERLLNEESGVGINLAAFIFDDVDANLTLSPYYRQYFGKKPAAGFFLEGTAVLITYSTTNVDDDDGITGAIGIAVGTKLLSRKNWVFEGFAGLNRIFSDEDIFGNDSGGGFVYPRLGISIGKRF